MHSNEREFVSLNGTWDLVFDPHNHGKDKNWFKIFPKAEKVPVPGVIEQVRPGYDGVVWYRREFTADSSWEDRLIRLKIGACSYYSEVWLNGEYLGNNEGGFSPFEFNLTSKLNSSENVLVLRVINPPADREVDGFRSGAPLNQSNLPVGKAAWYFNFGGIWQDVDLEISNKLYLDDIYVQPYPTKKEAVINVTVVNHLRAGIYRLSAQIFSTKNDEADIVLDQNVKLKKGLNSIKFKATFKNVKLWSLDNPKLYRVMINVYDSQDQFVDRSCCKFGMRDFILRNGAFYLNGKKTILKGFLQQGMYPRTLIFPETRKMAEKELRLLKDNGFNFIRNHLKPVSPWVLDLADEIGILIEAEPALGWICNSPETEKRCMREVTALIKRDRNHPSIILWCLMNEAYHFLNFTTSQIKTLTEKLAKAARKLDSTRLLIDTSCGEENRIMLPNSERMVEINDAHIYCPIPVSDASLELYRNFGEKGIALLISEFGAPDVPPNYAAVLKKYRPEERKLGLEDYQLHKDFYDSLQACFRKAGIKNIFGSLSKFIEAVDQLRADEMRLVLEAQRTNPNLVGAVFCQLADASGELFGATDVWREPKAVFNGLKAAATNPLLSAAPKSSLLQAGDQLDFRLFLVDEDAGLKRNYQVELRSSDNKLLKAWSGNSKSGQEIQMIRREKYVLENPGIYRLLVSLDNNVNLSSQVSEYKIQVLNQTVTSVQEAAVIDPTKRITASLKKYGMTIHIQTNNFRDKNMPILCDLSVEMKPNLRHEVYGQLKKMVQMGGCAVLFNPETILLHETILNDYLIRSQYAMRMTAYVPKHPIFKRMPQECVAGFEYADVYPKRWDRADDIIAAGGKVLMGAFGSHMWARPANYCWGAGLYEISLGRGTLIICHMPIIENLQTSVVARKMLLNIINYADKVIVPGGEEDLLGRCIDPLPPHLSSSQTCKPKKCS